MADSIAHYNLLERLGGGPLGELYRARDTTIGRTVALRLVDPAIAEEPARFARLVADARAAMGVSHPNVATLFEIGEEIPQPYLAHEFASGRPLAEEISGGPLNTRRALDLVLQMADGLADAHASGVIHGDLRPHTIIVTGKGSAKVLECGLAPWTRGGALRALAAHDPDALPQNALAVVAYLSPEQAIGAATDARSDVFMLGTIAFELLTGRNPFLASTPSETVLRVAHMTVARVSEANTDVPPELDAIIGRALSRNIDERHESAVSFAAALRTIATTLDVREDDPLAFESALLDGPPERRGGAILFAALAAAIVAALVMWWWLARP